MRKQLKWYKELHVKCKNTIVALLYTFFTINSANLEAFQIKDLVLSVISVINLIQRIVLASGNILHRVFYNESRGVNETVESKCKIYFSIGNKGNIN